MCSLFAGLERTCLRESWIWMSLKKRGSKWSMRPWSSSGHVTSKDQPKQRRAEVCRRSPEWWQRSMSICLLQCKDKRWNRKDQNQVDQKVWFYRTVESRKLEMEICNCSLFNNLFCSISNQRHSIMKQSSDHPHCPTLSYNRLVYSLSVDIITVGHRPFTEQMAGC